jgi:hypothetical protein
MSRSFTKLFSSITESTVWCEPLATRVVWITMLAMADRHGRVWGSVPGLAGRARVEVAEAEAALARFLAPDRYSRTQDHEGRRIEPIDGGWRLLNHAKYRAIQDEENILEAKRRWWNENRGLEATRKTRRPSIQADAEADAEADSEADSRKSTPASSDKSLSADKGAVICCIPINDGTEYPVHQADVDELERLYPIVDAKQTLNEIRGWNLANKARRKTRSGVMAHVHAWFSKEQNRWP